MEKIKCLFVGLFFLAACGGSDSVGKKEVAAAETAATTPVQEPAGSPVANAGNTDNVVDAAIVLPPPDLNPLNQVPVPEPIDLGSFVKNKPAAIRLGKALFWDMQTGSDGIQACGTCHFQAGADPRLKNQLNPDTNGGDTLFGNNTTGVDGFPQFGVNYTLTPDDFPLHRRADPVDAASSAILQDTNDIVSSQGIRLAQFNDIIPGSAVDDMTPIPDPVFNLDGVNTRRVEPRNTPTVINAIFNFSNFWDGRAHFLFNGENAFGPADPNAGVWFGDPLEGLVKRPVLMQFGSLASLSVLPPVSDFEMSARGRTFPKIGQKLFSLTPLGRQLVHPEDSVLGILSRATIDANGKLTAVNGLRVSYEQMVMEAFRDHLWNSPLRTPDGFTQREANFPLFFGLAVQTYLATLVSDQTPFDRWLAGEAAALTDQQKQGFNLFMGVGNCVVCHGGIEFTNASVTASEFINNFDHALIELMFVADGTQVIYDDGFNNIGVTLTGDDLGRGGDTPFINPLTGELIPLSSSALAPLQKLGLLPFETPIMPLFLPADFPVNKNGLFKVPDLRNVELTAPYLHNGSMMTLEQVMDFYIRGGNFPTPNAADLDPLMGGSMLLLGSIPGAKEALVAFMKSLTDERVRIAAAPFDHPEILVPEGEPEVLRRILATNLDGETAPAATLALNAVSSPTRFDSQILTGTVEEGGVPEVTVDTEGAVVGEVIVEGTTWRAPVSNLNEGNNNVAVRIIDSERVETILSATIVVDLTPPGLTLNPVASQTRSDVQTLSGTVERGSTVFVSVNGAAPALAFVLGTNWSFVASLPNNGPNAVVVMATDAVGNVAALPETVIAVVDNATPTIVSIPVTGVARGLIYHYDVDATDPFGDALTYLLVQAPAGMTIDAPSGLITWQPAADQAGEFPVTMRAQDAGALFAQQSFTVRIIEGFSITGRVFNSRGTGIAGVTMTLSGDAGQVVVTDAFGRFVFIELDNGTYTAMPSHPNFEFTPAEKSSLVVSGANVNRVNFMAVE